MSGRSAATEKRTGRVTPGSSTADTAIGTGATNSGQPSMRRSGRLSPTRSTPSSIRAAVRAASSR